MNKVIVVEYRDINDEYSLEFIASSQEKAEEWIRKNCQEYDKNNNVIWWWTTYCQHIDNDYISDEDYDFRYYDKYGKQTDNLYKILEGYNIEIKRNKIKG